MRNLTMMTDLYQLTMMYGYFKHGMAGNEGVFDVFFRPKSNITYAIAAGLQSVIDYINGLHFSEQDLAYLRSLGLFDEAFLAYLGKLRFTGEIYACARARSCSRTSRSCACARRSCRRS